MQVNNLYYQNFEQKFLILKESNLLVFSATVSCLEYCLRNVCLGDLDRDPVPSFGLCGHHPHIYTQKTIDILKENKYLFTPEFTEIHYVFL